MSDVGVRLAFTFTPRVAGGSEGQFAAECVPLRLDLFGTRELSGPVRQIVMGQLSTSRVLEVEFRVQPTQCRLALPFCDAGVGERSAYVQENASGVCAQSCAIIANLYARSWTECGQRIWTSLGGALMPLAVLLNMTRSDRVERRFNVVCNREVDAPEQPTEVPVKGVIEIARVETFGSAQLALRSTRPTGDIYQSLAALEGARRQMAAMIARGQACFFGKAAFLRPTIRALLPFHVPTNQTDFMLLPSSSYTMLAPREPLSLPYYEQLLAVALRRSRLSEADALRFGRAARDSTGARFERAAFASLVVRTVTVFALSQCYTDDILNLNNSGSAWRADFVCNDEDFKLCRVCGADDCEGCALEPHMHVNQLCGCLDDATLAQMSPLLRLVRGFLRTFVPCLVLGCVTNKQLTIDRMDQNNAQAHTFAVLVPFTMFTGMLDAERRKQLETQSRFAADRAADLREWRGIEPYPLFCEATAPIDPAMRPTRSYYDNAATAAAAAEAAVESRRAFIQFAVRCLKSTRVINRIGLEISGATAPGASDAARDQSTFYKYIVSLTTNVFADLLVCDFTVVYDRDEPDKRRFGVCFADFINASASIGMVTHLVYTPAEAAIVDAVLTDQCPIPNLVLPAATGGSDGRLPTE